MIILCFLSRSGDIILQPILTNSFILARSLISNYDSYISFILISSMQLDRLIFYSLLSEWVCVHFDALNNATHGNI